MSLKFVAIWSAVTLIGVVVASTWLPVAGVLAIGSLGWVLGILRLQHQGARETEELVARVEAVKGVRTAAGRLGLWADPARQHRLITAGLTQDLEESYFKLIKTNIQLLSLKEVGRSIIASLDRQRTMDSVLEYLDRGVGFKEYGLFFSTSESWTLSGGVKQWRNERSEWMAQAFEQHESSGILAKCLRRQRSYLIKDARLHPLGLAAGQELFPNSTHGSYIVVPLVCSSPSSLRSKSSNDCQRCANPDHRQWIDANNGSNVASENEEDRCGSCLGNPVLGCIIATDAGKEQPLSKVDLMMLETLAQNLATVLENAQLYDELRHEERFRENVIGGMSNGLVSVDLDGKITLFNQTAEQLSGYKESEITGRPSSEIIEADARGVDQFTKVLERAMNHRSVETSLKTAEGGTLPIQLTTSLLRDDSGTVYGAIGEFADLSGIKSMEAQIRHLDKLAAMGRFTSSIAHEIRNPLAGITAGIQYMTRGKVGAEAEHVSYILGEVDRLNRIINDLFTVGRPLNLNLQMTDVWEVVERSLRNCEAQFDKRKVHCRRKIDEELPLLNVDPDRLEQVLINFLQNAIDASSEGTTVEVEVRLGSSQAPMRRDGDQDSMIFAVNDHGEGISEEDLDKIFEPFFTKKSSGTGLGLYVCHHIAEGHGGKIVVDSQPEHGSSFMLCLPVGRILMGGTSETADLISR